MIPASIYLLLPCARLLHSPGRQSLLLPPTVPSLSQYDWEVARPPQPNTSADRTRVFCDAGGGLGFVECCRWRTWLLKYTICVIYGTAEHSVFQKYIYNKFTNLKPRSSGMRALTALIRSKCFVFLVRDCRKST